MRLRERNDYFQWRGDRYAFHQLVDGPVLARLDPDSEDEQTWTLHSRRVISPTGAEVRDIAKQVQGIDLPERYAVETVVRVRDDGLADRVASLEERVSALEAKQLEVPSGLMRDAPQYQSSGPYIEAPPVPETPPLPYNDEAEEEEEATSDPVPEDGIPTEFRALMLEGEPAERFTLRMKHRMQSLKHLQIDGTKPTNARALPDMTEEEIAELADLEARNMKSGNWLG